MGLARIVIAVLAVALALGLLILGGVSLWNALSSGSGPASPSPAPSGVANASANAPIAASASAGRDGNVVEIERLAAHCPVYVAGPGPTDVRFHGSLTQNERRVFDDPRLTVAVDDASTVSVTINGRTQPRGRRGQRKTYSVPVQQ